MSSDEKRDARTAADPLASLLDIAAKNFALDKDANGVGVLVGLSRAESVELVTLMAKAQAGRDDAPERRQALIARHFAAHCARTRQTAGAVH
jgi:hypothetical protein